MAMKSFTHTMASGVPLESRVSTALPTDTTVWSEYTIYSSRIGISCSVRTVLYILRRSRVILSLERSPIKPIFL